MEVRQVIAEVGTVEVLFNNAGVVRGNKYFWETDSVRDTRFTIDINTLAPMFTAREFLPGMIASGTECRIINMASAAGLTSNPRTAAYCGSKWAAVGWSDSVRLELAQAGHRHVKVTTVCPYYIRTGMFEGAKAAPFLPLLDPRYVVDTVWKRMKKGDAFVVLPRTVLLNEVAKGLLPVGLRDFVIGRVFGVHRTMENFSGRAEQQK
ncbi:SDR family NAD(P)-dependent oxidoreductase [Streptomyces sp. NA04227]|uniref:SDR family NAD(P)-dependent oxidoreductase n=1 Tax=Streptomyces sp. NA04227 TaxID=2742136 RepID=UPI0034CE911D